ncbi:MAG: sigma-70 family RNA polymerase sigma factor [Longimicrobiales bacterium]
MSTRPMTLVTASNPVQSLPPVGEASDSFEQEVVDLLPRLLATARGMCRNLADAEDLVADSVARAWRHRETLRDRDHLRGWLFRILTNTYITGRRGRAAQPELVSLDENEEHAFSLFERLHQPFLLWWGNPEQEFLTRLLQDDLEQAIADLPEAYRLVVLLADVQGFAYQEIADVLALPIGTVRSRLARGRSHLQKALWKHAQDAGLVRPDSNPTKS